MFLETVGSPDGICRTAGPYPQTPSARLWCRYRVVRWWHDSVVSNPPEGYRSVTPRIAVADVVGQIEFLRSAFGAAGEVPDGRPGEIVIGDSMIMVGPIVEREPFPAFLYVYVDDADQTYARAVSAGAEVVEEPRDTPYGDRRAMVRDPFGNVYQIAHRTT